MWCNSMYLVTSNSILAAQWQQYQVRFNGLISWMKLKYGLMADNTIDEMNTSINMMYSDRIFPLHNGCVAVNPSTRSHDVLNTTESNL